MYNEAGEMVALLAEVHNTPWAERCLSAMNVLNRKGPRGQYKLSPSIHKK